MSKLKVIKELLKMVKYPAKGEAQKQNTLANRCVYELTGTDRIHTGECIDFMIEHGETYLNDEYKVVKVNNLKYEVYFRNNPIARFFTQKRSSEYVMMLMGLIY